jgi:itaconyl-CoA hydratase
MTGKYYEELEIGQVIHHKLGRTVTEMDNVMFCALTMNTQPLHLNEDYASHSYFGQRLVNGIYTLGLVVGLSVSELTEGTILANLSYEKVNHPNPLFHGDTVYVETEVLDKRPSRSRPECGLVRLRHIGRKADGTIVIEVERTAMFYLKERTAETNEESDARP